MDKIYMGSLVNFFKYYNFEKKLYNIKRNTQDYIAARLMVSVADEVGRHGTSKLMTDLAEYLKIDIKCKKQFTFMGIALAILNHKSKLKHPRHANEFLKQKLK